MASLLTKTGVQLHDELNGVSCIKIQENPEPKKAFGHLDHLNQN